MKTEPPYLEIMQNAWNDVFQCLEQYEAEHDEPAPIEIVIEYIEQMAKVVLDKFSGTDTDPADHLEIQVSLHDGNPGDYLIEFNDKTSLGQTFVLAYEHDSRELN